MFKSEDPGTSLVFYFRLRSENLDDASQKLAIKFFTGAAPGRFKTMVFIDNIGELSLPSMIAGPVSKFNGKPVIVHKTGAFYNDRDVSEIDVDIFQFPVIAKTVLNQGRSVSSKARIRAAFVLQGETEEELPERLLGCCELRGLDIDACVYDKFN